MSQRSLAVIILAAGEGTRMKSTRPKVMHELAGKPMINWLIDTAQTLSPEEIVVVIGPDMKELEKACTPHETEIQSVRNGTGGAVQTAMPLLTGFKGDVLILLGDAPLLSAETLKNLIAARTDDLSILGCELEAPYGYGRLILAVDKTLEKIVEEKDAGDDEKKINLINAGAFCADGEKLSDWLSKLDNKNAQNEFYITQLPTIIAGEGGKTTVAVTKDSKEIQGCNTKADLASLESDAQDKLRAEAMGEGVTMLDPKTVYMHHDTKIAPGVIIEPNVFFGPGVEIGAGAHIKAFSHIEETKIGENVSVGPFARLRPGTEIGEDSRIGNFVEIKKSKIGPRSKINHLAYVGDTTMGEDVNFSAGAITVNYDGFEKHPTVIGKGVMVGSNVNLVAPLSIDDGAFIAAGSTITEDVPADALSIARDTAEVRQGWATEYRKRKAAIIKKLKQKS